MKAMKAWMNEKDIWVENVIKGDEEATPQVSGGRAFQAEGIARQSTGHASLNKPILSNLGS